MGANLLLREIGLALLGATGVWVLETITPLHSGPRGLLQGGVVVTTLYVMARVGGLI